VAAVVTLAGWWSSELDRPRRLSAEPDVGAVCGTSRETTPSFAAAERGFRCRAVADPPAATSSAVMQQVEVPAGIFGMPHPVFF
jgi:hypothetical protein